MQSELAGLAFDSLQQVFRKMDISMMFDMPPLPPIRDQMIWIVIGKRSEMINSRRVLTCFQTPRREVPAQTTRSSASVGKKAVSRSCQHPELLTLFHKRDEGDVLVDRKLHH
jgi:hypothetical protein